MSELLEKLAAHRRRIKIARTVETAVRWTFYASVLACVYLTASKIAGLAVPRALAATVLVAIPLGMAAREWARSFSVRDCAIHLDRSLGLEERLATAVEAGGTMADAQSADAAGALAKAAVPPRRLPREAKLLAGSALLLGALLVIPAPERGGATADPALDAFTVKEAARLEALTALDGEFRDIAELVRDGKLQEALDRLYAMEDRLAKDLLEKPDKGGRVRQGLEAAQSGSSALAAELARAGRTFHSPPPAMIAEKLKRQVEGPVKPGETAAPGVRSETAARLKKSDWDPKYDKVIRTYFHEGESR